MPSKSSLFLGMVAIPLVAILLVPIFDYNFFISMPYWTMFSYCYLFPNDKLLGICSNDFTEWLTDWTIDHWRWELEPDQPGSNTHIPEMKGEDFSYELLKKMTKGFTVPVVIRGLFKTSNATNKWTPEYFTERYGEQALIVLAEGRPEIQYSRAANQRGVTGSGNGYQEVMQPRKMRLKHALRRMGQGEKFYISNIDTIFRRNNDLLDDLEFGSRIKPWGYKDGSNYEPYAAQMFLGFGEEDQKETTGTMMHCAASANLFVQAIGTKYWEFVKPRYAALLRPSLGVMTPAAKIQGKPKNVPKMHVRLQEGDLMLNPPWMWHEIRNGPGFNIGVATRENHPPWIVRNNFLFSALLEFRATPRVAKMMIPTSQPVLRAISQVPFLSFFLVYLKESIQGPVKSPLFTAGLNPCDEHDRGGRTAGDNECTSTFLDRTVYADDGSGDEIQWIDKDLD